jgi:glutamate-ammonia-ligase adenylyltransferase
MQEQLDRIIAVIERDDAARAVLNQDADGWRRLLAISPFVSTYIQQRPERLEALLRNRDTEFDLSAFRQSAEALMSIEDAAEFDRELRRLRNEQMVLITTRDVLGLATLEQTLAHLSLMADVLVDICLRWQYEKLAVRHGYPLTESGDHMPLVVLGMGKLGGRELNFSSDIDLILAYEHDGNTTGPATLTHHEFFTRLVQRLYQSLNKTTEHGFVFRVDLRLRPYGNSGPMVMSFSAMEEYYQTQGREWERYALIKARAIGKDVTAGKELLETLQPFVYRRYLDFGVIQSLRDLKAMIDRETVRKDRQDNLKLGPGGIREIEFIGQVFQLMRGGQDRALRSRSTPLILSRLAERGLLEQAESDQLIAAWRFLRLTENHLQQMYDRQDHALPKNEVDQHRLALSMGFSGWSDFLAELAQHRQLVQHVFDGVFAESAGPGEGSSTRGFWLSINDESLEQDYLESLEYRDGTALAERLQALKTKGVYQRLSSRGKELMDSLMPGIIDRASGLDDPDEAITRLVNVISAIAPREVYLALLVESESAREQLAKLCSASSWVTEVITKNPALLDELIDPRHLYVAPSREQLNIELTPVLVDMDEHDVEMQMERLRRFKQAQQLRVAAADIMQTMPLMRVSDHLTWIAEAMVNVALELAWDYLAARHGHPMYELDGARKRAEFGVFGFGKLGGIELGYGSDLDLVFVHNSQGNAQVTDGDKSIDNTTFFTRLAQRLVHLLSTLTPSGVLYEVDTRLRPNGKSGLLVSSLNAFEIYELEEAWTWEHQALVRARPISGGLEVCAGFQEIRNRVLSQPRDPQQLVKDVLEMRQRMRDELDKSTADQFDLKQGVGGIVDIEFMVQYAVLSGANKYPELLEFTDNIRITETMSRIGMITGEQAQTLIDAYKAYRLDLHHRVLQGLERCTPETQYSKERAEVGRIWQQLF